MQVRMVFALVVDTALMLGLTPYAAAATPSPAAAEHDSPHPPKYDPDEPLAKNFSLVKSAEYLDTVAAFWLRKSEPAPKGNYRHELHSCGSCHANFAYLMARPLLLKEKPESLLTETRRRMEQHIDTLDCSNERNHVVDSSGKYHFRGAGPTLAAGLVFHDLHTGGGLRPTTRKTLNKMWAVRRPLEPKPRNGGLGLWSHPGFCYDLSAPELDPYYSAALAAIAAGTAPDGYARSEEAARELTQFRQDFGKLFLGDGQVTLHTQALALWAACRLDGLLTATQREAAVRSLQAAQCADGGWSLAKIGGIDGRVANHRSWHGGDPKTGDGYATGLVVYVLRQAGLPLESPEIARGIAWLKNHQRASGCWFTPNADRQATVGGIGSHDLAILNLGTAFAVMALQSP